MTKYDTIVFAVVIGIFVPCFIALVGFLVVQVRKPPNDTDWRFSRVDEDIELSERERADQSNAPLPSVPLWMTASAVPSKAPRKKTFEDLVAEAECDRAARWMGGGFRS